MMDATMARTKPSSSDLKPYQDGGVIPSETLKADSCSQKKQSTFVIGTTPGAIGFSIVGSLLPYKVMSLFLFFNFCLFPIHAQNVASPPNFIFMFADDLGFGDLKSYGHPYAITDNLDRLAREGTAFKFFHNTGNICPTSRAGFMTSRNPSWFPNYTPDFGFRGAKTVTQYLQEAGYVTGHIGKWNIGDPTPAKNNTGFPFPEYGMTDVRITEDGTLDPRGKEAHRYDLAMDFVEKNRDKPFYLNIWQYVTHDPIIAPGNLTAPFDGLVVNRSLFGPYMQENFDKIESLGGDINVAMQKYLGEVYGMDLAIGKLLNKLDELNLTNNTVVVFSSDNGPAVNRVVDEYLAGWAGGLRGGKHRWWEGGPSVPFLVRWPAGNVPAGKINNESFFSSLDWLPTICSLAGVQVPENLVEGEDVSDIWKGSDRSRKNPTFYQDPFGSFVAAVYGRWKILPWVNQLYDIRADREETSNQYRNSPEVVAAMMDLINQYKMTIPPNHAFKGDAPLPFNPAEPVKVYEIPAVLRDSTLSPTPTTAPPSLAPFSAPPSKPISTERRPNFIFMFADDLGFGDLRSYGHPYAITDNLDRLAREGTAFRFFHNTGNICPTSRAGFMTSRNPSWFPNYTPDFGFGGAKTVTQYLQEAGYVTGHIGKWNIGDPTPAMSNAGFPFPEYGISDVRITGDGTLDPRGKEAHRYDLAMDFVEKNRDVPFYLNIWQYVTHAPIIAPGNLTAPFDGLVVNRSLFGPYMQEIFDKIESLGGDINVAMQKYLGEVYGMDLAIGKLLNKLDELNLTDNTVVVFSSDNGPAVNEVVNEYLAGWAGGLRGGKHRWWEGGPSVPFLVRWPAGNVPTGKVNTESFFSSLDWLPTICSLAGIQVPENLVEGEDVSDIWKGSDRSRKNPTFYQDPFGTNVAAVYGRWKILPWVNQLYDIRADREETLNRYRSSPEVVAGMMDLINQYKMTIPPNHAFKGDAPLPFNPTEPVKVYEIPAVLRESTLSPTLTTAPPSPAPSTAPPSQSPLTAQPSPSSLTSPPTPTPSATPSLYVFPSGAPSASVVLSPSPTISQSVAPSPHLSSLIPSNAPSSDIQPTESPSGGGSFAPVVKACWLNVLLWGLYALAHF